MNEDIAERLAEEYSYAELARLEFQTRLLKNRVLNESAVRRGINLIRYALRLKRKQKDGNKDRSETTP